MGESHVAQGLQALATDMDRDKLAGLFKAAGLPTNVAPAGTPPK